jgi:hypothetical protein
MVEAVENESYDGGWLEDGGGFSEYRFVLCVNCVGSIYESDLFMVLCRISRMVVEEYEKKGRKGLNGFGFGHIFTRRSSQPRRIIGS